MAHYEEDNRRTAIVTEFRTLMVNKEFPVVGRSKMKNMFAF